MKRYNPKDLEPKWQAWWQENGTYTANLQSEKPKYMAMSMFNYPSGILHVGHTMNYTISDVKARYKRQLGYESYHPVGWDAFGLPAENRAVKAGVSPQESMAEIIPGYRKLYQKMGWSNDWTKEIATHTPEYYKWTQWIFSQMYKHGLAYLDTRMQWWCDQCQTVLANEQVESNGKCWRHDGADDPVIGKKEVKQWFFKITEYADELLEAIDDLDWTESVKLAQKNWIGRSIGAEVSFKIKDSESAITVFTTRVDTLFGATFLVVAPESESLDQLTTESQKVEVEAYRKTAIKKTEIERQSSKEKTGVFTGSYAINPVNNEAIPIWVADYVLAGYGTGAIMAVPAHDERDHAFAKAFDLPIKSVIDPVAVREDAKDKPTDLKKSKIVAVVENPEGELLTINWGSEMGGRLFIGGTAEGDESPETTALREVAEETGYTDLAVEEVGEETFFYKYYAFSKQETHEIDTKFVRLKLNSNAQQPQNLDESEKGNFTVEWVSKREAEQQIVEPLHRYAFEKFILKNCYHGEGVLANSGDYTGLSTSDAREKIVADLSQIDIEPTFAQTTEPGAVKEGEPFVERNAITAIVKHWNEDKYIGLKWKRVDWDTLITGGIEEGQTAEIAAIAEIREETGYQNMKLVKDLGMNHARFYHVPKKENRLAHFQCLYFELENDEQIDLTEDEQQKHEVVWLTKEEMKKFRLPESHRFVWDKLFGGETQTTVAREVTNYKMRDWSVSRQRYWGAPIPIINCEKCGAVAVPDKDLPVVLPELTDFQPSGDGRSALARAEEWLNVDCPECGGPAQRETDTLDTYICSSWYMYRYMDPHNSDKIFDTDVIKKWEPIDFYNGGDHATAHLLYARFIGHFFKTLGLVGQAEPFKQMLFNGKVRASDGTEFSKRKGNGVDPVEVIDSGYGADALRLYHMFAAPLELNARWDAKGVPGMYRFLNRLWNIVQEYSELDEETEQTGNKAVLAPVNRMIKKVTEDVEASRYNTAIAALMECLNELYKVKADTFAKSADWQQALEAMVACAAPFAPHVTEELWHDLGHEDTVHIDTWPKWEDAFLIDDTITLVVQVNGKVRANVQIPADSKESVAVAAAQSDEKISQLLTGQEPKKTIYIKNKLINFVV